MRHINVNSDGFVGVFTAKNKTNEAQAPASIKQNRTDEYQRTLQDYEPEKTE